MALPKKEEPKVNEFWIGAGVCALILIGLATCDATKSGEGLTASEYEAKKVAWIEKGKEAIASRLKDPNSVKFQGVYFSHPAGFPPLVCGQVNAKNSFGGYSGFQRFISASTSELSFLESDMEKREFEKTWAKLCL